MASIPGRSGRRRRVLNEEVLAASASHVALRASALPLSADAPRYSDAAAIENHPQITDFIPRRVRTIAILVLAGLATSALLVAGHQFITRSAGNLGAVGPESVVHSEQSTIATWLSSMLLLACSATCMLVYSIRRHRIDDYRGRFRVWRWAAAACLLASANSVGGYHSILAEVLSHYTSWTALRGGAVWWISVAGLPLTWIAIRTFFDFIESRITAAFFLSSIASYVTALASYLNLLPDAALAWEPLVTLSATLAGHWFLFSTFVSYARYVVLDAQGLNTRRRSSSKNSSDEVNSRKSTSGAARSEFSVIDAPPKLQVHVPPMRSTTAQITPVKTQANLKDWVDGRRRERDRFDADDDQDEDETLGDDRKLSKAERKQLRKLKARNRAA